MILTAVFGGLVLFILAVLAFIYYNKRQYKYQGFIIAEIGDNNWAILPDKYRVYQVDGEFYAIEFQHRKDALARSPDFKNWMLTSTDDRAANELLNKSKVEQEKNGRYYTRSEVNKLITRGALFSYHTEGYLAPATITKEGEIKILSQDDRAFMAAMYKKRMEFSANKWDTIKQVSVWLGTLLILGFVVLISVYFIMQGSSEAADVATSNIRQVVDNVVGVGG